MAAKMRATVASIFGRKNGSLRDLSRGRRKPFNFLYAGKTLTHQQGAMPTEPQISFHGVSPPFSSSGGTMIHRLCTDYLNRWRFYDKSPELDWQFS